MLFSCEFEENCKKNLHDKNFQHTGSARKLSEYLYFLQMFRQLKAFFPISYNYLLSFPVLRIFQDIEYKITK